MRTIDELLLTPYWIVDILPKQVPKDSPGQYFEIEEYYLQQIQEIKRKHTGLILKLNCYRDIWINEEEEMNPSPERIVDEMYNRSVCIRTGDSMIVSRPDETYMTVYDPDAQLLDLLQILVVGEGLYLWRVEQE